MPNEQHRTDLRGLLGGVYHRLGRTRDRDPPLTLCLQDTGAAGHEQWIEDLAAEGVIDGVFLGPFHLRAGTHLADATQRVQDLRALGLEVQFDPMTHGAALPQTAAWHLYRGWEITNTGPPNLTTDHARRAHVAVCARLAETLTVPLIGPTVCLDRKGTQSELAIQLAEATISAVGDAYLQVAA